MLHPNDKQVAGNHYQGTKYQHWDWIAECHISYLEGNATKYIVRHKNKAGLQDLEKAIHYVEKIRSLLHKGYKNRSIFMNSKMEMHHASVLTDEFILGANLDHEQAVCVRLLMNWETSGTIGVVLNILRLYSLATYPTPAPTRPPVAATVPRGTPCTACGATQVGDVCPRVGCGAAMNIDSRAPWGMEDPRGYEGDG